MIKRGWGCGSKARAQRPAHSSIRPTQSNGDSSWVFARRTIYPARSQRLGETSKVIAASLTKAKELFASLQECRCIDLGIQTEIVWTVYPTAPDDINDLEDSSSLGNQSQCRSLQRQIARYYFDHVEAYQLQGCCNTPTKDERRLSLRDPNLTNVTFLAR